MLFRSASFSRSTMVGERGENVLNPLGKKGALYKSPRKRAVAEKLGPDIPVHVWTGISAPVYAVAKTFWRSPDISNRIFPEGPEYPVF